MRCQFTLKDWRRETGQQRFSLAKWKLLSGLKRFTLPAWCDFVEGGDEPAPYHADAVHFDGANSSLRIAALAAVDSGVGALSFWLRQATAQDSVPLYAIDPDVNYVTLAQFDATATLEFDFSDEEGDNNVGLFGDNNCISANAWHHVLCAWKVDLGAGLKILKMYVDDVDVSNKIDDTGDAFDVVLNGLPFYLGSDGGGGDPVMDLADFWFAPNQSLLTGSAITEATRRKFISAGLKPVDLGGNGEIPTGVSPVVFHSGDADHFAANRGTGGASSLVGNPFTNASTSPSD